MTKPRPNSTRLRRQVFDANKYTCPHSGRILMPCCLCPHPIDPVREPDWIAEHVNVRNAGGSDGLDNVKPAHHACAAEKTSREATQRAQVRRGSDRHFGIKRSSRPMPCGRGSKFKKKLDGTVVLR